MSDPGSMIPISDEQAKAIQEALKTARGAGSYFAEVLGTVPHDIVGLLGGDWLRVKRAENAARIVQKASERLRARNATPEPASLSIGLPILKAAADESREELQDLWARLLAAAADPGRSRAFRLAFIEIVKKMDPLDAIFLLAAAESESKSLTGGQLTAIANRTGATPDQVDISAASLKTLGVLSPPHTFVLSALGREFVRAISN